MTKDHPDIFRMAVSQFVQDGTQFAAIRTLVIGINQYGMRRAVGVSGGSGKQDQAVAEAAAQAFAHG